MQTWSQECLVRTNSLQYYGYNLCSCRAKLLDIISVDSNVRGMGIISNRCNKRSKSRKTLHSRVIPRWLKISNLLCSLAENWKIAKRAGMEHNGTPIRVYGIVLCPFLLWSLCYDSKFVRLQVIWGSCNICIKILNAKSELFKLPL